MEAYYIISGYFTKASYEQFWGRGYKTFFMLNSAGHEIQTAHEYWNSQNQWNFQV